MANYRKIVRDAVRAALNASFNTKLAAALTVYGRAERIFTLDFSGSTENCLDAFLANSDDVDLSEILKFPACVIYTPLAQQQNREKGRTWSGLVQANVDIYLRFRYREDTFSNADVLGAEDIADAVEDALSASIAEYAAWPAGVNYSLRYAAQREPLRLFGDGWEMKVPIAFQFDVYIS